MTTGSYSEDIVCLVLGFVCMALNSTEIILISKKRKVVRTFELILLSFAVADFTVGLSISGFGIYKLTREGHFSLNDSMSYLLFTTKIFSVTSSITHILGISVDRFCAVSFPLKHKIWMSRQNAKWLIAVIWITSIVLSLVTALPQLLYSSSGAVNGKNLSKEFIYTSSIPVFLFGAIFIAVYSNIVWKVVIQKERLNQRFNENTVAHFKLVRKIAQEKTLVLTCVLAVLSFIGCTYPAAIILLVSAKEAFADTATLILFVSNSILNPFIYFLKGYLDNQSSKPLTKRFTKVNGSNLSTNDSNI